MNATSTPSETAAFLRTILPPEADDFYCALVLSEQQRRQFFFRTIEELAAAIIEHDRQGRTIYHACATFKDPQGPTAWIDQQGQRKWKPRGAQNASRVKAAWLDIDAGPGKAYSSAHHAAAQLGEFCNAAGLPAPCLVGTGGGIHAYWPYDESCSGAEGARRGHALKVLCSERRLAADPSRTADISSVLRTPGTHNYKYAGGPLVKLETDLRCYSQQDLQGIIGARQNRSIPNLAPSLRSVGHSQNRRIPRLIDAITAASRADYGASFCDNIANKCAQLALFRSREALGEPRWYACVGVTAWATDGKVKTHEWCEHDPKYSEAAVAERMARVLSLSGPTTCAKLESLNPQGCAGCLHRGKISSPISLGATRSSVAPPSNVAITDMATREVVDGPEKLPPLADPFRWAPKGELCYVSEDNNGQPDWTIITHEPLYLTEVQKGEVGKQGYSYLFRHHLPHEGWKYVSVDADHAFASNAVSMLAKRGIVIHDTKLFFLYVRGAVSEFHQNRPTGTRYDQFGWKANQTQFFVGKYLYTPAGKITVQGGNEVQNRAAHFGPRRPDASLVVWTEAADALFGKSSLPLGICVLASFAAPLMRLLLNVDGGCIVHLFSSTSGAGKSWALDGAWSVWGTKKAMMLVNDDTKVSKPIVMGTLGNLPICYDEIWNKDQEVVRMFVNLYSDGRDRLRGTADGGTRQVETTWCNLLLSNSNHDLLEILDTLGVDAPGFRVLQLMCPSIDFDKETSSDLKRRLEDNCGVAGDKFLQYIVNPDVLKNVRAMLDKLHTQIWAQTKLSNAHRYRVAAVTCILVAGLICRHLDILHFDIDKIRDYLMKELADPTNAGTVSSVAGPEMAQARLADFLNAYQGEILTVSDKFRPGRNVNPVTIMGNTPRARISARYEIATRRLYIAETSFREWCLKNQISLRDVVGTLHKSGVVVDPKRKITLTAGTSLVGAQALTIELDGDHPALSGVVTAIDRLVTQERSQQPQDR